MTAVDLHEPIQKAIDELIDAGGETGVQVAVFHHGELVADVTGGVADTATGRPVGPDTLFWAASTAKGMASTVVHVLVERGEFGYDLRVADVWPEFAAHGKDTITVRHLLCHTAGVPGLPPGTTPDDLGDWERMCALLADAEPRWAPGSRFGYHSDTFGYLVGETVRRATGCTLSTLLRDLVTAPLGIADEVHFGVPAPLLPRVATQVDPEEPSVAPGPPQTAPVPMVIVPRAALANRRDLLSADIPSMGTMTARAAATVYAALLGRLDAVGLVSAERLAAMAAITYEGPDVVMGMESSWAFGYSPARPTGTIPGSTFGMLGGNGSAAFADIRSGTAVAVMRNRCSIGDFTAAARVDRLVVDAFNQEGAADE
ncbi:MAG TPA: serine hydrolase domain-containing protein [Trebonia sp.]